MLAFAYYLLKVSLCSALLFSYYFFVLRNKRFHQYNRFYLLGIVLLSWITPLTKIEFWNENVQQGLPAIRLLQVVAAGDTFVAQSKYAFISWNFNSFSLIIFTLISAAFFIGLIISIVRICMLINASPNESWNNINFIFSEAKGTPFSFFRYIFWNKKIDLQTEEGKYILQHELTHVYEKHSADKLFLQVVLVAGWFNPIFWLIRKELNMIHEFIADERAISDGDADSFSAMLLKTAYPQHSLTLTNSFFHSPIKRRLIMFTTSKKASYSYLRRLMTLPLLCIVIVFFSFKSKGQNSHKPPGNVTKISTVTVDKVVVREGSNKSNIRGNEETDSTIKKGSAGNEIKTITNSKMNVNISTNDTTATSKALVILDGVQMSWEDFQKKAIEPELIKSMTVLKGKVAIEKYGQKGSDGVIEVTTTSKGIIDKGAKEAQQDTIEPKFEKVFTKVENPPYYSKGMAAFADYIQQNMQYPSEAIKSKKEGAVSIQFIIDENGNLNHFKKVSDVGFGLEEEAIRLLEKSSDWTPGIQNGHKVPVEIVQQIIFTLPGKQV